MTGKPRKPHTEQRCKNISIARRRNHDTVDFNMDLLHSMIAELGGAHKTAAKLGLSSGAVYGWTIKKHLPRARLNALVKLWREHRAANSE